MNTIRILSLPAIVVVAIVLALVANNQSSVSTPQPTMDEVSTEISDRLREVLAPVAAQVPITAITTSEMEGVYQVILANEQVLYINSDGSHFVVGDLYKITDDGLENLSESAKEIAREALNDVRVEEIAKIDPATFIIYPAKGETLATLTVFTDVDCPYCRKMHSEMASYNELGITIRYAAYPRAGLGSNSYNKMVDVWCAEDSQQALTVAKQMKPVLSDACDNPVAEHLALGERVGVLGTPAIITEQGEMIPGYMPAPQLAQQLGIL